MLTILCISIFFMCMFAYAAIRSAKEVDKQREREQELLQKLLDTTSAFASMRVKHGLAWEAFVPMMEIFEDKLGPKCNAVFLGQPIDLIYFNDDEIVFVEVKTGNSRLSNRQRHVRDLVKEKKIRWEEVNDSLKSVLQATDPKSLDTTKMTLCQEQSKLPYEIPSPGTSETIPLLNL